jgi:hypothetical protein
MFVFKVISDIQNAYALFNNYLRDYTRIAYMHLKSDSRVHLAKPDNRNEIISIIFVARALIIWLMWLNGIYNHFIQIAGQSSA